MLVMELENLTPSKVSINCTFVMDHGDFCFVMVKVMPEDLAKPNFQFEVDTNKSAWRRRTIKMFCDLLYPEK